MRPEREHRLEVLCQSQRDEQSLRAPALRRPDGWRAVSERTLRVRALENSGTKRLSPEDRLGLGSTNIRNAKMGIANKCNGERATANVAKPLTASG